MSEDNSLLAIEDPDFLNREEMRAFRLAAEYSKPELVLRDHKIRSTVVVFGSARLGVGGEAFVGDASGKAERYYGMARAFARLVAEHSCQAHESDPEHWDFVIATGGGPAFMEAANRGAADIGAPSIGLNIDLPREQHPNPYISEGLSFSFRYFALRKMHFVLRARALACLPGGFGTLDELFDALTLMQTGKIPHMPVLLFGQDYWKRVINFDAMVEAGTISAADRELVHFVDEAQDGWRIIAEYYGLE